jgi:uncharacterized protein (TIGR03790 family)
VDYRDVGVIVNDNDSVSQAIGSYFTTRRGIPERNVIHVRVTPAETIVDSVFVTLRAQVEAVLISRGLADSLNYLVTTKGLPLRVDRGGTGGDVNSKSASVDAELMLILGQWKSHIGAATLLASPTSVLTQPFYGKNERYRRKNLIPGQTTSYDLYLVTRLTGLTKEDVFALIDRSGPHTLVNKDSAVVVLDQDPTPIDARYNFTMETAATTLAQRGWRHLLNKDSVFVTQQKYVLGYVSWGSNDDHHTKYATSGSPSNQWSRASIAETYVSTSARNFVPGDTRGQSRIADLIAEGCTGASGYVFEPFSLAMTWVDILFERYTNGYNLAESFYMANPTMSWMAIVVGDPKTSIVTSIPPAPHPVLADVPPLCQNGVAMLEAKGALPGTMLWFKGDSAAVKAAGAALDEHHPLFIGRDSVLARLMPTEGLHTFTFYNANMSGAAFAQVTVDVQPALHPGFLITPETVWLGSDPVCRFSDTTRGALSWAWDFGDSTAGSAIEKPEHTYAKPGNYAVRLTVSNGACTNDVTRQVQVNDGQTAAEAASPLPLTPVILSIAPIPFSNTLTVCFMLPRAEFTSLSICNMLGSTLHFEELGIRSGGTHVHRWSGNELPTGVYFLILRTASGDCIKPLIKR